MINEIEETYAVGKLATTAIRIFLRVVELVRKTEAEESREREESPAIHGFVRFRDFTGFLVEKKCIPEDGF